jgi:hypothetical protein
MALYDSHLEQRSTGGNSTLSECWTTDRLLAPTDATGGNSVRVLDNRLLLFLLAPTDALNKCHKIEWENEYEKI